MSRRPRKGAHLASKALATALTRVKFSEHLTFVGSSGDGQVRIFHDFMMHHLKEALCSSQKMNKFENLNNYPEGIFC